MILCFFIYRYQIVFLQIEVKVVVLRRLNGDSRYTSSYNLNSKPFLIVNYGVKKQPFFRVYLLT